MRSTHQGRRYGLSEDWDVETCGAAVASDTITPDLTIQSYGA